MRETCSILKVSVCIVHNIQHPRHSVRDNPTSGLVADLILTTLPKRYAYVNTRVSVIFHHKICRVSNKEKAGVTWSTAAGADAVAVAVAEYCTLICGDYIIDIRGEFWT